MCTFSKFWLKNKATAPTYERGGTDKVGTCRIDVSPLIGQCCKGLLVFGIVEVFSSPKVLAYSWFKYKGRIFPFCFKKLSTALTYQRGEPVSVGRCRMSVVTQTSIRHVPTSSVSPLSSEGAVEAPRSNILFIEVNIVNCSTSLTTSIVWFFHFSRISLFFKQKFWIFFWNFCLKKSDFSKMPIY